MADVDSVNALGPLPLGAAVQAAGGDAGAFLSEEVGEFAGDGVTDVSQEKLRWARRERGAASLARCVYMNTSETSSVYLTEQTGTLSAVTLDRPPGGK